MDTKQYTDNEILSQLFFKPETQDWYMPVLAAMELVRKQTASQSQHPVPDGGDKLPLEWSPVESEKKWQQEQFKKIFPNIENDQPDWQRLNFFLNTGVEFMECNSQSPDGGDEVKEFLRYVKEAREQFCRFIAALEFSVPLRTEVDSLLICFDQMKEHLSQPAGNDAVRLQAATDLLKGYEEFEAALIGDNSLWRPNVMKDAIRGKAYDLMIELQSKRNEFLALTK